MKHIHFNLINSTQIYLNENLNSFLKESREILISSSSQTHGIGRAKNSWISLENSIAFSFTLTPSDIITLSSLEIGLLVQEFISIHFNKKLFLKWPNDIVDSNLKKVGGIISTFNSQSRVLIVGIGINLGKSRSVQFDLYTSGNAIDEKISNDEKKLIPFQIYQYILKNRYSSEDILNKWNDHCIHINKEIKIIDTKNKIQGKFVGIGSHGEAIIQNSMGKKIKYYSGNLIVL